MGLSENLVVEWGKYVQRFSWGFFFFISLYSTLFIPSPSPPTSDSVSDPSLSVWDVSLVPESVA